MNVTKLRLQADPDVNHLQLKDNLAEKRPVGRQRNKGNWNPSTIVSAVIVNHLGPLFISEPEMIHAAQLKPPSDAVAAI